MKIKKPKLIVIVGPTASGKSELAVKIAKKIGGEIISADSRQIYRGLDIGTGKIHGSWHISSTIISLRSYKNGSKFIYKGIPHYCIDFVSPKKIFSAAEYKKCADTAIQDINSRGKIPILAGGTAFWIDALVYDLNFPAVPPNLKLRKKLAKKTPQELLFILKKLNPERALTIEQKNPRRLIRAIEIAKKLGKVPKIQKRFPYNALWIGLIPNRETLSRSIKKRANKMIKEGLLRETKKLLSKGVSKKRIKELGFEYRAALDALEKKIGKVELLNRLTQETLDYARRQMTWWKRNPDINWIKIS